MLNLKTSSFFYLGLMSLLALGCGGTSVPDTPDGMLLACAKALDENKPGVIWEALPASYQKDVTSLVHDAAAKMDADVYDKTFVILNKVLNLLKDKRDIILELVNKDAAMSMMVKDKEKLDQNWDNVVDLLAIITSSEIQTLDGLRNLDVGRFVDKTGSRVMEKIDRLSELAPEDEFIDMKNALGTVRVEVLSLDGNTAKCKLFIEGKDPQAGEMVKVEGKWIPKEIADAWKDMITEAKKSVSEMTGEEFKQQKPMIMGMMTGIETTLDQLAEAKTSEEFAQIIEQFIENMMGM